METEVKKRRVMARDHTAIAEYIGTELTQRKQNDWRRKHEERWTEVDTQIAMDSPAPKKTQEGESQDWHSAIQLGDLTDASETLTADILRLAFPDIRKYFRPHIELPLILGPDGTPKRQDPLTQRTKDGNLRSLMVQQQIDFGHRGRCKLALKEILHHGSVVVEPRWEFMKKYHGGSKVETLGAPVAHVHSMWNCYPDPRPFLMGTELFYKGSMLIEDHISLQDALEEKNWINKDKLQENDSKLKLSGQVPLILFFGDIFLKRHDGNILFPNRKTIVSNGVLLFSEINETPYSPILYLGYERDDVRDPYYTSPIVKRAPMGKFVTAMANKTVDSVDLRVQPPVVYDSMDNALKGGGPQVFPGASIPSRTGRKGVDTIEVGAPEVGLAALQWGKRELQEGTAVDSTRKGVSAGTEQTATEVVKSEQRAEVREVDFVADFDLRLSLPFLYMQHQLNLLHLDNYPFFNDEVESPDFGRASKGDLPKSVLFEVTGSRELLGEEQRTSRFINTVTIAAKLPPLANNTDWAEVGRQLWADTRVKDPDRFLMTSEGNAQLRKALEDQAKQFQEAINNIQEQLQKEVEKASAAKAQADAAKSSKAQVDIDKAELELQKQSLIEQLKLLKIEMQLNQKLSEQANAEFGEGAPTPAGASIVSSIVRLTQMAQDQQERSRRVAEFVASRATTPEVQQFAQQLGGGNVR